MFYLLKMLSFHFDLRKIIINTYLITFLVLVLLFPKDIILKPDLNYFYLILFSFNLLFGLCIWYYAIINNVNLGKLDGLAIALYLPMLVIMSKIFLNQEYKIVNYFGILLISIGAYLTLK